MQNSISILTLIENSCMRHRLMAMHGQSLLISYHGNDYLFDVGENYDVLKNNLTGTETDLKKIKAIIISHEHLDHCGALPKIISELDEQRVYLFNEILTAKEKDYENTEKYRFYKPNENGKLTINLSHSDIDSIKQYSNLVISDNSIELEPGLFSTGVVDGKVKERAIVVDLKDKGIVVILGCSHPTLPKMVAEAQKVTGNKKVYGIIGGFHFKDFTADDFTEYIAYLKALNLEFLVPSHCTGNQAVVELQKAMPDKVKISSTGMLGVGNSIDLEPDLEFNFA